MKKNITTFLKASALCFGFFAFITLQSCREKNAGYTDLVPGVDNVNTFGLGAEELNAQAFIRTFDSVNTGDPSVPVGAIGTLANDPFYGAVSSGLYLQFTVPQAGYSLPDSITAYDSLVLVIPYTRAVYGDTAGHIALNVFEIEDPSFKVDTSSRQFYAFSTLPIKPGAIGSYSGQPSTWITDTMKYPSLGDAVNQMRIKLDATMLSRFASISPSDLHNNGSFLNFFNGLYIEPNTLAAPEYRKALFYFLLAGSNENYLDNARLELHFERGAAGTKGIIAFPYNPKFSAFFNHIERDDIGYPSADYRSTGLEVDSFLLTGLPGFQTDLVLNDLDQIPTNAMIHLARLEINVKKEFFSETYTHPNLLMLNVVEEDGTTSNLADYQITAVGDGSYQNLQASEARAFVGGQPVTKMISGEEYYSYTLNFPRQVQRSLFEGKKKLTLRLFPFYQMPGAYRLIAPGFNEPSDAKAKINIVYTKP